MQLIRFDADGRWHIEPTPLADPSAWVRSMFIDSSNTLWIGQGGRLYRRPLNQAQYFATGIQLDWLMALVEMPDHSLWINDIKMGGLGGSGVPASRTRHIDSEGKLFGRLAFTGSVLNLLYFPDGSLIIITYSDGILRFSAEALAEPEAARAVHVSRDGLERRRGMDGAGVIRALQGSSALLPDRLVHRALRGSGSGTPLCVLSIARTSTTEAPRCAQSVAYGVGSCGTARDAQHHDRFHHARSQPAYLRNPDQLQHLRADVGR
jgi:hypothetical protein